MRSIVLLAIVLFMGMNVVLGQTSDTTIVTGSITERYVDATQKKILSLQKILQKKTLRAIAILQKRENRMFKTLSKRDSLAAKSLVNSNNNNYEVLKTTINNPSVGSIKEYLPAFDSLKSSLEFLNNPLSTINYTVPTHLLQKIKTANTNIDQLQASFNQAEKVKLLLKERRNQLIEQFKNAKLGKEFKRLNRQVYYYQQQIVDCKALLKDRKKAERKGMEMLRKLPAFQEFMRKNSQLASLFRVPENYGTPQNLAGLQTRASVQAQIQQTFASSNVNPQQYIGQQVHQAQAELNKLKDKINNFGGGDSDIEMPNFTPNTQRTKRFIDRVEIGTNIQSQKVNGLLPVTTDMGLTAGFKVNDKSVIGVGVAYKVGWGKNLQHIRFTNEGFSLRSFVDIKLKGNFWITGGYEQNYQHSFRSVDELRIFNAWQSSGLLGITRKIKIGKKTNNVQVLWDFLSYGQVPRRQEVIYRLGFRL